MTFTKVMTSLSLRFTSGNNIPVESARITREEWDIIQKEIERLDIELARHQNFHVVEVEE